MCFVSRSLPARESTLAGRISGPGIPGLRWKAGTVSTRITTATPRMTATGRRLARAVMRRPVAVILGVAVVILVLTVPAFHLRPGIPGPEILPASVDSRAGNDLLTKHIGYANRSPVLVVVKRDRTTAPSTLQSAGFAVLDRICSSREVVGVAPLAVLS